MDELLFATERGRARPPSSTVQPKSYHYRDCGSVFGVQQIIDRFLSCRHPVRVDIVRRVVSDGRQLDSAGRQRVGLGDYRRLSFAARQRVGDRNVTGVFAFFEFAYARGIFSIRVCSCPRCLCRSNHVAFTRFITTAIDNAFDL